MVQRELDICPNPVRHEICDLQFNTTFMSILVLYKVTQTSGNLFLRSINRGGGYCSNRPWQVNPVFEDERYEPVTYGWPFSFLFVTHFGLRRAGRLFRRVGWTTGTILAR
jgi:hypothetical protein